jgi:hypothetical protein
MDNLVALTILEQLGGRRLMVMTGAHTFIGTTNGLSFRLPSKPGFVKNGINLIEIELTPLDVYTVTCSRIRHIAGLPTVHEVSKHTDIYAEDLQPLFMRETGLATHL